MSDNPASPERWAWLNRDIDAACHAIIKRDREPGVLYLGDHDYLCLRANVGPGEFWFSHSTNEERYRGMRVVRVREHDYLHVSEKPL